LDLIVWDMKNVKCETVTSTLCKVKNKNAKNMPVTKKWLKNGQRGV